MNAEINVTSLVDVAFTLLVIFIITAPIMQGGIEVDLPKADVPALRSEDKPFFITIDRDGTVYMEDARVASLAELETGLSRILEAGAIQRVYIRGDSLAPYGVVLRTITTVNNSLVGFGLVAEPYRPIGSQ